MSERYQRADDADVQQPWALSGMAQIMAETKPLPTLEDDPPSTTPPSRKPRYFVLAMYPSGAMIVEIADSPKVRSLFVEKEK
jgi:hypothetical protein